MCVRNKIYKFNKQQMRTRILLVIFLIVLIGNTVTVKGGTKASEVLFVSEEELIDKLPEKAQTFVKQYFSAYQFGESEKNKHGYYLFFVTLGYIRFDAQGEWKEIDGVAMQLPSALTKELPQSAVDYMKRHYNGSGLKKIVRHKNSFNIQFIFPKNSMVTFDAGGKLLSDTQASPDNSVKLSME